jgi:hypothetical protein
MIQKNPEKVTKIVGRSSFFMKSTSLQDPSLSKSGKCCKNSRGGLQK